MRYALLVSFGTAMVAAASVQAQVTRTDVMVDQAPGNRIFVREIRAADIARVPVLLIHGGGGGGLASFDPGVPGYSLAEDLAGAGHPVYVMDIRGWGRSSRPASLASTNPTTAPAVTSDEVVEDITAVVEHIRAREKGRQVALLGHASGGHWAGMYAASHADLVGHLVMVNSMYSVKAPWPLMQAMQDPSQPGVFNPRAGACRNVNADGLLANWNTNIPVEDKTVWRDPRVADAYVRETIDPDPSAKGRTPPATCLPRGFQRDHFAMAQGRMFWNAASIRAATMVVRGSRDHWSRPEDVTALRAGLTAAARVQIVEIPEATHFLFLDRAERGRQVFIERVIAFLGTP